jgi:hypothetical protein
MRLAKDPSEQARRYIDASLKTRARQGRAGQPTKAAYARAIRLAKDAIEDLMHVSHRAGGGAST